MNKFIRGGLMNSVTSALLCLPMTISLWQPLIQSDVVSPKANNEVAKIETYLEKINKQNDTITDADQIKMLNEMSLALNKQMEEKAEEERQEALRRAEEEKYITKTFIVTFYTSLNCENGYGSVNSRGEELCEGMVASNVYPIGTEIDLGSMGKVIVSDRGGKDFNNSDRLDMLISRNYGESDSHYYRRVNKMGKRVVTGKILKSSMNSH